MKQTIRRWAHAIGYDIRKYRPADTMELLLPHVLKQRNVDVVLDIGANQGQFAKQLRETGYAGRIISVEPLKDSHEKLTDAARHDPNWIVAERMAIGDKDGEISIHRSANAVSSSVLDILPAHTEAAPQSAYEGEEVVPLRCLDSTLSDWVPSEESTLFLKIDVQGYEDRVLAGAQKSIGRIIGIQAELSLVPLYRGQILYDEMMRRFRNLGYDLYAVMGGFADRQSGRMYQFDVLYVRP
jgi:FkbM family methyltransferase